MIACSTGFADNQDFCTPRNDQFPGKCSCPVEQEYLWERYKLIKAKLQIVSYNYILKNTLFMHTVI
jgi:hypothetical protein